MSLIPHFQHIWLYFAHIAQKNVKGRGQNLGSIGKPETHTYVLGLIIRDICMLMTSMLTYLKLKKLLHCWDNIKFNLVVWSLPGAPGAWRNRSGGFGTKLLQAEKQVWCQKLKATHFWLHDPKKIYRNLKLNFIQCPIIKHLILSSDSLWRFCPWTVCVPGLLVKNVDNF